MLRKAFKTRPIIAILAGAMLMVALACAGDSATPTSPPTATSPAPTATAVPDATATAVPEVDLDSLPAVERLMKSPGYLPEWGTPVTGGILRMGGGVASTSFHAFGSGSWSGPIYNPIDNQLMRFNPWVGYSLLEGDLVKSWEFSSDNLELTLRLREGVKFQDVAAVPDEFNGGKIGGDEFVCEDVQASFELFARPPAELKTRHTIGPVELSHVTSVTCPDGARGHTAVFNLDAPKGKTLAVLTMDFSMLDKDYMAWFVSEDPEAFHGNASNETWAWKAGYGPFEAVPGTWDRDLGAQLRRNPTYWREGLPLVDGTEFFIMKDSTTRFAALATGQIHYMGQGSQSMLAGQVAQAQRDFSDKITVFSSPYNWSYGVGLWPSRPPFDDVRVRKAIQIATNRDEWLAFNEAGTLNRAALMAELMPFPYANWGHSAEELVESWPGFRRPHDQDVAEANRLLDEVFGEGQRFSTVATCRSGQAVLDNCIFFKDQMRKLGIDVTVEPVEGAVNTARSNACDIAVGMNRTSSRFGDVDDQLFKYYHRDGVISTSNLCRFNAWLEQEPELVAEIEGMIEAQSVELDMVERRELTRALDKKIFNEVAIFIPHGQIVVMYGITPALKGYTMQGSPLATYSMFEKVWLAE